MKVIDFGQTNSILNQYISEIRNVEVQNDDKTLIITDPMLATGGSMELSYQAMLTKGHPAEIHVASIIASQKAIDHIKNVFPEDKTTIWCAAIDPEINEHSYIVPGLGDAGDLAYGEKE